MNFRKTIILAFLIFDLLAFTKCAHLTDKKEKKPILLADREAPIGWIYLKIYEDKTFEFISNGLRNPTIYTGNVIIKNDTLYFHYKDSIPSAGKTAILINNYVAYIDGEYPERIQIKLNELAK